MSTDIQQSLFDEQARMEQAERDNRMHRAAFRAAYDFLNTHYPPEDTEQYWLQTCADVGIVSAEHITNELCQELLTAVLLYLSNKVKKEHV